MSSNNMLEFDVKEQLEQITLFTEQQQKEVKALVEASHNQLDSTDALESAREVENRVSDMLEEVENQLEQEISKINQQLKQLLPEQRNQ
jgi:DNA-binding transcriptional regulator GbsR (MarR family)